MKIGLNGERLLIAKPAGPEVYTFNLYQALAEIDRENRYIVYFNSNPPSGYFASLSLGNPGFSSKVLPKKGSWTQISLAWELIKNPVAVFFSAVHTIPIIHLPKTKIVGMIHGLEYKTNQAKGNPLWHITKGQHEKYVAQHSDAVIVPSQATKNTIMQKGWVTKEKITVISEGVNKSFFKRPQNEIAETRRRYFLGGNKYLLFVSTIQPRKNIPNLVHGFSLALKEIPDKDLVLLISGKKGWDYEESFNAPKKYGVENFVIFLGRTPDEDLPKLLSGAEAFISTSFEEGFGLPLLEALACETPAIISDIPAFREIGGNLPIYVDPRNPESIKDGILETINAKKDNNYTTKAREIANKFTWEKTAQKTLKVFQNFKP